MVSEVIMKEVETLRNAGYSIEVVEEGGMINLIFSDYSVPLGFNKATATLLVRLAQAYPNAAPDMFWVDVDFTLRNGGTPRQGDQIETYVGKRWRRFSWHPQRWHPASDNLQTYLEFIDHRLAQGV